jgi:FlgN protein
VTTETHRFLELLEQRIALLSSLAQSLSAASTGFVSFDLDQLESGIADQERLCSDIRALDEQIDQVQRHCAKHIDAGPVSSSAPHPDALRLSDTAARLSQIQSTVKRLNAAHQILLRRSRRTVGALLNSYYSFAMTYCDPSAPRVTVGERL